MDNLQLNTKGFWEGGSSTEIEYGEKAAVKDALVNQRIPIPNGKYWDAIKEHYHLPEPVPVDKVQAKVVLPPGWKVEKDTKDVYGRCCIIYDHEHVVIGRTFLKNTGYDYYGSTNFEKDRLKELGIMK